jgi:hypothetical protein
MVYQVLKNTAEQDEQGEPVLYLKPVKTTSDILEALATQHDAIRWSPAMSVAEVNDMTSWRQLW